MSNNDVFIVKNRPMMNLLIKFFVLYASIYGIISIMTDDVMIRGIKDAMLVWLVFCCFWNFFITKDVKQIGLKSTILFLMLALSFIGLIGNLNNGDMITYVYGMKITVLPIGMLFVGMMVNKYKTNLDKLLLLVFVLLISTWVGQFYLGVDSLISMGFEYGKNVKHINGFPRLPSIVGSPDGYAFLLCIVGILLENCNMVSKKKKVKFLVKVVTLSFLLLSTIRSALLLWLAFQFIMIVPKMAKMANKNRLLVASSVFFIIPLLIISWFTFVSDSKIGASDSLKDRLSHWGANAPKLDTLEGWTGRGFGNVGAASLRLNDIGAKNDEYAVDNQFLALYEQTGLIGTMIFLALIIIALIRMKKHINERESVSVALALLLATLVSCMFTNIFEMYPFNVILWVVIGSNISTYNNEVLKRKEFYKMKRAA